MELIEHPYVQLISLLRRGHKKGCAVQWALGTRRKPPGFLWEGKAGTCRAGWLGDATLEWSLEGRWKCRTTSLPPWCSLAHLSDPTSRHPIAQKQKYGSGINHSCLRGGVKRWLCPGELPRRDKADPPSKARPWAVAPREGSLL